MNKGKKKKIIGEILLMIALLVFVISMLLNDRSTKPEDIWNAIVSAKYNYFFGAIGILFIYTILYSLPIHIICYTSKVKINGCDLYLISTSECFFSGITPGAVGGQPFQVFAFNQANVDASKSTGIILMNFVCGMIGQLIVALISLCFYPLINDYAPGMIGLFWLGFSINVLGVSLFIFLGISKTFRKIMVRLVSWISKWRIFRKFKNIDKRFEEYIVNAQKAFAECLKHKMTFFVCVVIKIISYLTLYMIPFFVLKALNLPLGHGPGQIDCTRVWEIICLTSFATLTANYLPTPGATGGLEFAFKSFFLPIVIATGLTDPQIVAQEVATASAGVLLWRIITYYLLMLYSFMCYLIFTKKKHVSFDRFRDTNNDETSNLEKDNDNFDEEHVKIIVF